MPRYDAFVSYSHAEDRGVAKRLQAGVERFAKPWYRMRGPRLFLDTNSLSANPALWSSIERALADSAWFVLVASARAATSEWVEREIRWWLEHRSPDRLLIVVADGSLSWDSDTGDFDAQRSTALPPSLLGVFAEEPQWVTVPESATGMEHPSELDLRETIVDVATAIRGVSKEELVSAAAREHRRTMRWVRGAIASLAVLLLAAIVAGAVALSQRATAIDQANLALSRQIASVAEGAADTDLAVSMLLAVQAYRIDANAQTRTALFSAATSSPKLVRFLDAGRKVERVAGSDGGEAVVAGLVDGRVLLWPTASDRPMVLFDLPRRINSLAINRDGSTVAAADRSRALLWRRGKPLVRLPVPVGQHADVVALSPSGATVAYHAAAPVELGDETVTVSRVADLSKRTIHPAPIPGLSYSGSLVLPSERRLLLFSGSYWQWRRIADWSKESSSRVGLGAHQYGATTSADGRFFTATNGASRVPVWPTRGHTDTGESDLIVEAPVTNQTALALSPDGAKLAVGGSGVIYVAPVPIGPEPPGAREPVELTDPSERPVELTGADASQLAFAGDESRLVSASGAEIGVWDLDQLDRLAHSWRVPLLHACNACGPPLVAVSPDGERAAAINGDEISGFVRSLHTQGDSQTLPEQDLFEYRYSPPIWSGDGSIVAFPLWPAATGSSPPPPAADLPPGIRVWRAGPAEGRSLANAIAADGKAAIIVDAKGGVYWRDVETGEELDYSPRPAPLSFEDEGLAGAAIDASPELLAVVEADEVVVEQLPSHEVTGRIDAGEFASVAFAGNHLLVQRRDGPLEVWNERGTKLQRTLAGDESLGWPPVGNADGTMAARRNSNGEFILDDLESGARLATFSTRGQSFFFRTGVAFSADGATLVAVSELPEDPELGEVVRRDISDTALVRAACEAAGRNLTAAEWRAFVGTNPPADLACR